MFFFWYLLNFFLIINSCISDQVCINSCQFNFDIHAEFTLPHDCTYTRREQCAVMIIFDYEDAAIEIDFGFESDKPDNKSVYDTDNIIITVINLEDPSFIRHTVTYYCSTGDNCDLNYVKTKAIPLYAPKACQDFRKLLVERLYPDPSSSHRDCFLNDTATLLCEQPCDLSYNSSNQISRSCGGRVDLAFETTVGQSSPVNKPEYTNRIFAYACTPGLCNGLVMQNLIRKMITTDNGECMIFLNETIETTTSTFASTNPSMITSTIITTTTATTHHNHATTFSNSFISIIFILFFQYFFL
jgi:hypothetical protein